MTQMFRSIQPGRFPFDTPRWGRLLVQNIALGALLGWLLLHPLTMVVYSFEHRVDSDGASGLWRILTESALAFSTPMLFMSGFFALIGGAAGLAFTSFHRLLFVRERALGIFKNLSVGDLPSLIAAGENEHVEFKRSARWDAKGQCVNRALEQPVTRTIAGFLNHRGGSLVIGVADNGEIVGLEDDYRTLNREDRDGFEQFVVGLVNKRLGGDLCPLVHVAFGQLEGKDVCRLVIEPSSRPVYFRNGRETSMFVRMGNSTRALDVREAIEFSKRRWPSLE